MTYDTSLLNWKQITTYDIRQRHMWRWKKNCPEKSKRSKRNELREGRKIKKKRRKNQRVFWSQSDKDHSKSCLGRVENGKSRENKPFHQHRVKYNDYEAQIKYPHNAALACWCITLAVAEASSLATGQTSSTRQIWCLKRTINLSHRASGPHLVREINRILKLYGDPWEPYKSCRSRRVPSSFVSFFTFQVMTGCSALGYRSLKDILICAAISCSANLSHYALKMLHDINDIRNLDYSN